MCQSDSTILTDGCRPSTLLLQGRSRLKQLEEWCGKDFDGLIVFDESESAACWCAAARCASTFVHVMKL